MSSNKIIQSLLNHQYPRYAEEHKQPLRVIKAIEQQQRCRTPEQGVNYYRCFEDGEEKEVYHSCRNRGCTICGEMKRNKWLDAQKERLLNSPHYHLVFTIPHEYLPLWLYNRKGFINTHFEVVNETLQALLQDNEYNGKQYNGLLNATAGIISTLHTWGRSLNLHPHIHVLLTAGGLNEQQQWISIDGDFLVPVKRLKSLYRGKFQAKIKAFIESDEVRYPKGENQITLLQTYRDLFKKEWSVRIQEQYEQGNGVLIYLSRYLGAAPIKPEQIEWINHKKEVLFSYWSHREQRQKKQRLTADEFLKKYLMHQPEPRVHTIRYYGLYNGSAKKKREASVAELGETRYQKEKGLGDLVVKANEVICQCCGALMVLVSVSRNDWKSKNPLYSRDFKISSALEGIFAPIPSG
jgi:hypothetical protein